MVVARGAGERGLTIDKRHEARGTAVAVVTCSACCPANGAVGIGFGHHDSSPDW